MKTAIAAYAFCLAAGAFLARFELHTDDAGVEVFLVLAVTFLLGCLHPRQAWQWALLVGAWIPGADLVFGKQGLQGAAVLLAVVAAIGLAGTYAGVFLRRTLSSAMS